MHLAILEDYICDLMDQSLEKPHARRRLDIMCGELMDILLLQEQVIPDFVVDGDSKTVNIYGENLKSTVLSGHQEQRRFEMKKLIWLGVTVAISGVCFLIGFFVAP